MAVFITICVIIIAVMVAAVGAVFGWRYYVQSDPSRSAALTKQGRTGRSGPSRKATRRVEAKADDKRRLAYRYDDGAVFIHRDTVWTGVRLRENSDFYMSQDDIDNLVIQATRGLRSVSKADRPVAAHYRITHQPIDVQHWATQLLDNAWDPSQMYADYVNVTSEYLRAVKTMQPVAYLLIQIETLKPDVAGRIKKSASSALMGVDDEFVPAEDAARWERTARRIAANLRDIGAAPITRRDRMWLIRKPLLGHYIPAMDNFPTSRPWGAGEFQLWTDFNADNRRQYLRIDATNADVDTPDRAEDTTMLESYTAFLAVADWDHEVESGHDTAWMRWFAARGLELSYRVQVIPPNKYLAQLEKINNNLLGEIKSIRDGNQQIPAVIADDQFLAEQSLNRAKSHDGRANPGLEGQILVQISSDSLDGLNTLLERVKTDAKDHLNMTLVRPSRFQLPMLETLLPGKAPALPGSVPFARLTDPAHFGIGLPRVGTAIGDERQDTGAGVTGWVGNYLGMANVTDEGTGTPVFHSPHVSTAQNAGGGVFVVGGSGGGKSSVSLLMFFQASESGVQTVVLDPKVDFAQFCYYMAFGPQVNHPNFRREAEAGIIGTERSHFQPINKKFWNDTLIVNVVHAPNGVLDPWQIREKATEGAQLAHEVLTMFLGDSTYNQYQSVIRIAFRDVMRQYEERVATLAGERKKAAGNLSAAEEQKLYEECVRDAPRPTLYEVIGLIEDRARTAKDENASWGENLNMQAAAAAMEELRKAPYANLAFADRPAAFTDETDGMAGKRRIVFTLAGMQLPKNGDQGSWKQSERMAAAIMYILVTLASELLINRRDPRPSPNPKVTSNTRPTMLIVDESYMVTAVPAGLNLLRQTLAQGRSYNLITVLIDQIAGRLASIEKQDADNPSGNQIGSVFGFLQRSRGDAAGVAPLLTQSNTDAVAQALLPVGQNGQLATGRCLFRDVQFRLASLDVDLLFVELLHASDTNPATRARSQSYPISPSVLDWAILGDAEREQSVQVAEESAAATAQSEEAHSQETPVGVNTPEQLV